MQIHAILTLGYVLVLVDGSIVLAFNVTRVVGLGKVSHIGMGEGRHNMSRYLLKQNIKIVNFFHSHHSMIP